MHILKPLMAVAAAMTLAACSFSTQSYVAPSPALAPPVQPAATGTASFGGANSGGTYPYGTATSVPLETAAGSEPAGREPAGSEPEGIILLDPEGNVTVGSWQTDGRYRADVESCYTYAQARIDHDARIEDDVNAAFQTSARGFGLRELRGRMNNFERTQRRPVLFTNCMAAKGYARQ